MYCHTPRSCTSGHRLRTTALMLFAACLLSACSATPTPAERSAVGAFPTALPANVQAEALARFTPPETLGTFVFQGTISFGDEPDRTYRYVHQDNPEHKLNLAVYPLPPGWASLPPSRVIGGHYGMARQRIMQQSIQRGARETLIEEEREIVVPELVYPLAIATIRSRFSQQDFITRLILGAERPFFIRATISAEEPLISALGEQAQQALLTLVLALREQGISGAGVP